MGCGKTSVGQHLAEKLGATFVDLDARIESVFGVSIPALFQDGEANFRAHERAALVGLTAEPAFSARSVVVATGGGVVIDGANVVTMKGSGVTVFIDVPVEELVRRLTGAGQSERPLLASGDPARTLSDLLDQRRAAYETADVTIHGVGDPPVIAGRIEDALRGAGWPEENAP